MLPGPVAQGLLSRAHTTPKDTATDTTIHSSTKRSAPTTREARHIQRRSGKLFGAEAESAKKQAAKGALPFLLFV